MGFGVRVSFVLVFDGGVSHFAVAEVGFVEFQAEVGDAFVLGSGDVCDGFVLVDDEEVAAALCGTAVPCAIDAFLAGAAVDGVDDDAFGESFFGG